jgi:EmrB/QacA subfamily drug resistance transporter
LRTSDKNITSDDVTKRSALLIAVLASFLTPFMVSSINVALPAIGTEFGMGAVLLSWVPASYLVAAAMFLVPFGRMADIHGRKKIFFAGIGVYTLSSLLIVFSPTAAVLLAFRVVQGVGSAMIFGTGVAIVTSVFSSGERGRVLGINVAAVYLGLSLGPFLGGFLTQQLGWRSIFLANVPLGMVVMFFVVRRLKGEWAEAAGETFDFGGAAIYCLSLAVFMYGLSVLPERGGIWLVVTGLLLVVVFILWELRVENPLLDMRLFVTNSSFSFSNVAALINYGATFSVTFLISLYLQYIKGLSPQHAGAILVAQPLVMALFSPAAGRLSDRIEPRIVASVGMGFTTVGLALFAFLQQESGLLFIVVSLIVLGFGFALFSSPNTNAIMGSIEKKHYGVGSAMLGTMRLTGQMLSMGIAMVVISLHIGNSRITPELYPIFVQSERTAFGVSAVLCGLGIFASLARGSLRAGHGSA